MIILKPRVSSEGRARNCQFPIFFGAPMVYNRPLTESFQGAIHCKEIGSPQTAEMLADFLYGFAG